MKSSGLNRILRSKGQTVIETLFMLSILLLLFFLIAEIARAFYLKNSLNNAVRVAVRVAAVTPGITDGALDDSFSPPCDDHDANDRIACVFFEQPGVPDATTANLEIDEVGGNDPSNLDSGDTVTVSADAPFDPFVPFISSAVLPKKAVSGASMRYE